MKSTSYSIPLITLMTDYGLSDHYVGVLKGTILSLLPEARIVDITHQIRPHDVSHGAYVLRQIWSHFPPGSVHLAVVDPGVGSSRRIILGRYQGSHVVAPDNGLVTHVHRHFQAELLHSVENPRYFRETLSTTFHGRDIMAPVAAHLASGVQPREFGPAIDDPELLPIESGAKMADGVIRGSVIHVDGFGNLITNVHRDVCGFEGGSHHPWIVTVNDETVGPIRGSFFQVPSGAMLAYIGSSDFLEIAINQGRAVDHWPMGERLIVEIRTSPNTP